MDIWENCIKLDLGEIGRGGVSCIYLTQDKNQSRALVNTIMKKKIGKSLKNCTFGGFS
jgi:hypothetical protein